MFYILSIIQKLVHPDLLLAVDTFQIITYYSEGKRGSKGGYCDYRLRLLLSPIV